jgi:transmembrane sensor
MMEKEQDLTMDVNLINKYLDNRCTEAEKIEVAKRLSTDDSFSELYRDIDMVWGVSEIPWRDLALHRSDIQADWQKINSKINPSLTLSDEHKAKVASRRTPKIRRAYVHMLRLAAIFVVMVLSSLALTYLMLNPEADVQEIVFREISTDRNQRASIQLSDGTKVNLSVDSRIKMPDQFARDVREIELKGEAYFDVAHSPDRPFIIRSGNTTVQVLGTDFGVRAYPDEDQIRVVVKSGSVAVRSIIGQDENSVILQPGQLARVASNSTNINTEWVDPDSYLGWIDGKLSFNQNTLSEVISQLERWYDLEVVLENQSIKDRRLTAVIDSRSLNNVLNVISQSVDLSYEVIDNKIFLRNKNNNPKQ